MASRMAEQMNSRMYLLTIVAALFLPLGFVTGLMGVNVAGIPAPSILVLSLADCFMLSSARIAATVAVPAPGLGVAAEQKIDLSPFLLVYVDSTHQIDHQQDRRNSDRGRIDEEET